MDSESNFPLISLRPAVDSRNAWVALLLEADAPFDTAVLERLLFDFGLAEVLQILPCALPAEPEAIDPALGARLPAGRLVLRVPVMAAADPARHPRLAALQAAGLGLMAEGFPAADAPLFPGIASLAVACPGHAMPAGFGDWLRRLPGPHLALGTTQHVCPGFCRFHWIGGHRAGQRPPPVGEPAISERLPLSMRCSPLWPWLAAEIDGRGTDFQALRTALAAAGIDHTAWAAVLIEAGGHGARLGRAP